jgi:hypothetical protein
MFYLSALTRNRGTISLIARVVCGWITWHCVLVAHMEHRGLCFCGGAKLVELVHAAGLGLVLFALNPALGLVALLLLSGLFLLTFRECRSASRHTFPLNIDLKSIRTILNDQRLAVT